MAKTKISEYDATASNNTDVNSVDIAEGCAPSGVNNAIREVMGALKRMDAGTDALTSPDINGGTINSATINASTVGASTPSTGAFTNLSANSLALGGTALTATAAQLNSLAGGSAANNGTITVTAGNALTGGGNFTVNQAGNTGITLNHEDTSSQATVTNSGTTYIQSITLDTYGHITNIASGTVSAGTSANDSTMTITAGSGLTGGGTFTGNQPSDSAVTVTHGATSSQASLNNSGQTFIQDVTLDSFGHVTGLATGTATSPTVNDSTLTITAGSGLTGGGTFTGNQASGSAVTVTHADTSTQATSSNSGQTFIQGVTLDTYGHVTGLATGVSTSGSYSAGAAFSSTRLSALGSSTENRLYMGAFTYQIVRTGTWSSATGGGWYMVTNSPFSSAQATQGTQAAGNFTMVVGSSDQQVYRFFLYLPAGVTVSSTQGDSQTPTASGVYVKVD